MPKGTIEVTKGKGKVRIRCRTKFKLGNRKSTTCATTLSDADLVQRLEQETGSKKDRVVIRKVLAQRGFTADILAVAA
jgi:hypothetical protein